MKDTEQAIVNTAFYTICSYSQSTIKQNITDYIHLVIFLAPAIKKMYTTTTSS